ncbi:MAG: DUF885 domain-containing protein [Blastocatellia bacterium]
MKNQFDQLADEYLADLYLRHPALATDSGIHDFDGHLEDMSKGSLADETSAATEFKRRFAELAVNGLHAGRQVDHAILTSKIEARLLELEQIKTHERNPRIYSDVISTGLLPLALFEFAPAQKRLRSVIERERQVPRLLESARENLGGIAPILHKTSIDSLQGTLSFVRNDLPLAFKEVSDPNLIAEFSRTTASSANAIEEFIEELNRRGPDADRSFALGRPLYEARLRSEEGIDVSSTTLLAIAERELAAAQREFRETTARIDSNRDPMDLWREVESDHAPAGELANEARKQLQTLIEVIKERQILSLPEARPPIVSSSPDFMRWTFASLWTSGPFEPNPSPPRYFVTDVDPAWNERQKEEYLCSINFPQLWITSIHEAYPGHAVQAAYMSQVESKVRRIWALGSIAFIEGWAHYTEQMMVDEGFGGGDPRLKLGQLADALLRLCRFVVAIKEHTMGMTVEDATQFFKTNAYLGETPARIEAERGTFDPGYLAYSVGKIAIMKLRTDFKNKMGAGFSLREFHDRLLRNGVAPLWAHRRLLLGDDQGPVIS